MYFQSDDPFSQNLANLLPIDPPQEFDLALSACLVVASSRTLRRFHGVHLFLPHSPRRESYFMGKIEDARTVTSDQVIDVNSIGGVTKMVAGLWLIFLWQHVVHRRMQHNDLRVGFCRSLIRGHGE